MKGDVCISSAQRKVHVTGLRDLIATDVKLATISSEGRQDMQMLTSMMASQSWGNLALIGEPL